MFGAAYQIFAEVIAHFVDAVISEVDKFIFSVFSARSFVVLSAESDHAFSVDISDSRVAAEQ